MLARYRLLLPVPVALLGLSACAPTTTAAPTGPAAPAASAAPAVKSAAPAVGSSTGSGDKIECPSPTTLEGLTDLPKDWTFEHVDCVKNWAAAVPEGPGVGDGFYLFQYRSGKGWVFSQQGSGIDCVDLGLTEPAPFCLS